MLQSRGSLADIGLVAALSVIVYQKNEPGRAAACVRSVEAQLPEAEVLLIDDSRDNFGFANATLSAARQATGEHLLFLDSWIELQSGFTPAAGHVTGGLVLDAKGLIRSAGGFFYEDLLDRRGVQPACNSVGHPASQAPPAGHAASVLSQDLLCVPRDHFLRVGGFDPSLRGIHQGADLCARLATSTRLLLEPQLVGISGRPAEAEPHLPSCLRFAAKWKNRLSPELLISRYCEVLQHPTRREIGCPTCSVVVFSQNTLDTLPQALQRLRSTLGSDDSLIIVGGCSTDGTDQLLRLYEGRDPRLEILCEDDFDLSRVSGDLVLLAWPSFAPSQGWLGRLMAHIDSSDRVVTPLSDEDLITDDGLRPIDEMGHALARSHPGQSREVCRPAKCLLGLKQHFVENPGILEAFRTGQPQSFTVAMDSFVHDLSHPAPACKCA